MKVTRMIVLVLLASLICLTTEPCDMALVKEDILLVLIRDSQEMCAHLSQELFCYNVGGEGISDTDYTNPGDFFIFRTEENLNLSDINKVECLFD